MAREPKEPQQPNRHEKERPDYDKQVPPNKTPTPREPKPGKHGR